MSHFHAIVAYAELCFVLGASLPVKPDRPTADADARAALALAAALPAKPPQAPAPPQAPCCPAPAVSVVPLRWESDPDGTADLGLWRGTEFQGRYFAALGRYHPWDGAKLGLAVPPPLALPSLRTAPAAVTAPGTHCHRCTHCGASWCHSDASHGNLAAHLCPACGAGPHWNPVARPAVVQPQFFAPAFRGGRACPGGG